MLEGATRHRFRWRSNGWFGKKRPVANADLWKQIDTLLEERQPLQVAFTKVRAHCTDKDVQEGRITAFDLAGNTAADELAVTGACQMVTEDDSCRQSWLRASVAISVQHMMVEII